jgi:hypothetical protein
LFCALQQQDIHKTYNRIGLHSITQPSTRTMNRTIKSGDAKYNLLQNHMIQFLVAENSKDVNFFPTPAAFRQNYVAEFEGISGDSFGNQFRRIKQHSKSCLF